MDRNIVKSGQAAKDQATMNAQDEANQDYESQATLRDKDGQPLASVRVSFSPKLRCGGFRLLSSAEVHPILTTATSLQTSDGKRFRIFGLRHCPAVHLVDPGQPHIEFDYEPLRRC
jgi:hypothetical protein